MRRTGPWFALAVPSLLTVSLASAQAPAVPDPESEGYVLARVEAVVDFIRNDANDPNLQYSASPFLVDYLAEHGAAGLSDEDRADVREYVVTSLEGLREAPDEPSRLRGGVAIRLAPWFADAEVRDLLYETLELNLDHVAWRPEFFAAIRRVGLTESLPHFQAIVGEFGELAPEELQTARYPYPVREAFACLAVLGGDAEAPRLAPYLRDGVSDAIRGPALTALGAMGGERSRALLGEFSPAAPTPAVRWAWGEALCAHDDARGVRVLLDLVRDTGDLRAWSSLRVAAARPLPSVEDAERWVERLGDASLLSARRAAIEEGGYGIGGLATAAEREALLAAAADDEEYRRRAAWDEVVRLLGSDPSHGRFWTFRAERRGIEVDVVARPGQRLADEDEALLRKQQAEMLARARERLSE